MTTPQKQRSIRLQNDYKEMQNIKGDIIQWQSVKGEPPYVEAYELTVNIRTIIAPQPEYRNKHIIYLELLANYPNSFPQVTMRSNPPPFHPNWYTNGKWCPGKWNLSEGLGDYVIRMIRTLQFDLDITNPDSPANYQANEWFLKNRDKGLFPCDKTPLPDPTKPHPTKHRFILKDQQKKKFEVKVE